MRQKQRWLAANALKLIAIDYDDGKRFATESSVAPAGLSYSRV